MSEAKKTTAKTAVKTTGQPGPKPDFQVVEDTLKCQTKLDGEVSISLVLPYAAVKKMMDIDDVPEAEVVDFVIEQIMPPAESQKILSLQDGVDTFRIAMQYTKALGERLGASLGESESSSDS